MLARSSLQRDPPSSPPSSPTHGRPLNPRRDWRGDPPAGCGAWDWDLDWDWPRDPPTRVCQLSACCPVGLPVPAWPMHLPRQPGFPHHPTPHAPADQRLHSDPRQMPRFMPVITHRNFVADRPPPPDIRFKPAGSLLDSLPNLSEEPVFYPRKMGDPPSPTSTHYSDASTRRNSIDLDPSSFGPYFAHRQHPSHQSQQASIYFPPETVSPPPLESSRPPMAILQSTRGGTAALTPDLAAQLTEAQIQLSLRKKQRDSIPPVGYICRLCAIEGHWMENCILYKSNKYPQYNNAARAVALNIISPDSQVVLNSLPVVQQPKRLFTPKFFAAEKLRQLAVHEQQRQSCDSAQTRGFHTQQMHQSTFPSSSPTDESCSLAFGFTEASHISPRSGSRFEQIWKSA